MLKKGMSKSEIDEVVSAKGDFVAIDYLTRFLDEDLPIDMRKFVYGRLAKIYEAKSMFVDAGKMFDGLANSSIVFTEKIKNHVKEAEAYVKAASFERVDTAIKKAFAEANATQRGEIYFEIKEFYKRQAEVYIKEHRTNAAVQIYEKLASMKISEIEKDEIKKKLIDLYEKLGKTHEAGMLRGV